MPLDSLGSKLVNYLPTVTDPFERIGIVPVSKDFVAKHKKAYREAWKRDNPNAGFARWATATFNPNKVAVDRLSPARPRTLKDFLHDPTWNSSYSSDRTSAPKALVALALMVQKQEPDAIFSVDHFYDDPVLNVTIDGQKGCLGIWYDNKVMAIATKVS